VPADAIENLKDRATRLEPRYGEPWFKLANALKDQNRLPESRSGLSTGLQDNVRLWRPNLMLGIMYFTRMDRTKDAAERFRAAIANAEATGNPPGSSRAYLMLAGTLDELGDEQGCRQMLQRAAAFPDVRDEAMQHLREMGAPVK
jgi:tetratricopeptide (TPR) repeat protein